MTSAIDFVYHEARLIDEKRFDEWYELFTDDALYWMPLTRDQPVGEAHTSLFYEDKLLLKAELAFRLSEIEKIVTEIELFDEPGFESKFDSSGRIVELTENGVGRFYNDESFLMGKVINGDHGATFDRYRVRPKVQLFFDVSRQSALFD